MNEQWLPVPGYEGLYSVSNLGQVRSEDRVVTYGGRRQGIRSMRLGRILQPGLDKGGYPLVSLWNGRGRSCRVHELVMLAFVGPPPYGLEVLHFNDIKTDNHLSNLRYGTRSENMYDSVRNGRHYSCKGDQ